MTVELVVSEPVTVHVPVPTCEADGCDRLPVADCLWWDRAEMSLHRFEVCYVHMQMGKREVARGATGALFYPLHGSPSLDLVMRHVVAELRARHVQTTWRQGESYGSATYNGLNINVRSGFRWRGRI